MCVWTVSTYIIYVKVCRIRRSVWNHICHMLSCRQYIADMMISMYYTWSTWRMERRQTQWHKLKWLIKATKKKRKTPKFIGVITRAEMRNEHPNRWNVWCDDVVCWLECHYRSPSLSLPVSIPPSLFIVVCGVHFWRAPKESERNDNKFIPTNTSKHTQKPRAQCTTRFKRPRKFAVTLFVRRTLPVSFFWSCDCLRIQRPMNLFVVHAFSPNLN